jgi:hypothetical protein
VGLEHLAPRKPMTREVAHSDRWGVSADRQHVATGREDVVAIRKPEEPYSIPPHLV